MNHKNYKGTLSTCVLVEVTADGPVDNFVNKQVIKTPIHLILAVPEKVVKAVQAKYKTDQVLRAVFLHFFNKSTGMMFFTDVFYPLGKASTQPQVPGKSTEVEVFFDYHAEVSLERSRLHELRILTPGVKLYNEIMSQVAGVIVPLSVPPR